MDGLLPDSVLASLPLYVFVLTPEGRFRYLNRAGRGRSIRELLGRSLHEYLEMEDARQFDVALNRVLSSAETQTIDIEVPGADHERRQYALSLAPFAERGRVTGVIGWALETSSKDGRVPAKQAAARLKRLSPRQRLVLTLVARGLSNREIARRLGVSVRTVETHREQLSDKLELRGAAALTRFALAAKLV